MIIVRYRVEKKPDAAVNPWRVYRSDGVQSWTLLAARETWRNAMIAVDVMRDADRALLRSMQRSYRWSA